MGKYLELQVTYNQKGDSMKRLIVLVTAIIVVLMAGFIGKAMADDKPLCEFFASYSYGVIPSGLLVYYDGREYDESWFPPAQRSIGGMKFVIELGYWLTAEERDAMADTVEKVTFTNVTKETKYTIKYAFKYFYTQASGVPTYNADYVLHLGQGQNFIGQWEVELVARQLNAKGKHVKNVYTANFEITENMVIGKPVVKINDITVKKDPFGSDGYQVCFTPSNPQAPYAYRIRMIDGDNIVFDTSTGGGPGSYCPFVPAKYAGFIGRVEARLLYGFKLSCPDNILVGSDGATGLNAQQSRQSMYFKLVP